MPIFAQNRHFTVTLVPNISISPIPQANFPEKQRDVLKKAYFQQSFRYNVAEFYP